jgi:hypothetical protein
MAAPIQTPSPPTEETMSPPAGDEPAEVVVPKVKTKANTPSASGDWVRGVTIVDGAAVYQSASFDSTVLEYIGENKQVIISKKAVRGAGGLGLFYRLKANGGKTYYITDTDVKLEKGGAPVKESGAKPPSRANLDEPAREKKKPSRPKKRAHIDPETGEELTPYFTRYVGGALGMVNYSEKFSGHILNSNMPIYGFRMTGPGTLIDGPPIDFNFLFSITAPDYYSTFTKTKPTGFMLISDVMPMFPFYEWKNTYVYYGVGLMWTYTSYKVKIKNSIFDSQELRIGAEFGAGWGYRMLDKYMLRLDAKYYYEKTRYLGYFLTFQTEY